MIVPTISVTILISYAPSVTNRASGSNYKCKIEIVAVQTHGGIWRTGCLAPCALKLGSR